MTYNQLTREEINERLKNINLEVLDDYVNTKEPCTFNCLLCGEKFIGTYDRVRYRKYIGCSKCYSRNNKYINRVNNLKKNKSKYIDFISYDIDNNMASCKCLLCGEKYESSYDSVNMGCGHRSCSISMAQYNNNHTLNKDQLQNRVYEYGNNISILNFDITKPNEVDCECNVCNFRWIAKKKNLLRGRGCPECAKINRKVNRTRPIYNYNDILNKFNLELEDEIISGGILSNQKINVRCKICGYKFVTTLYYLQKCNVCCVKCNENNRIRKSEERFIKQLNEKNGHIIMTGVFKSMSDNTDFMCLDCKKSFIRTPHDTLRYLTCPYCSTNSKMEYLIINILNDNSIEFDLHKTYPDLRGVNNGLLSYDFYIPSKNIFIEAQGEQHEHQIEYFGGEESFKIQQEHDKRKREYAKEHNIELLEIWYYESNDIEKILNKKLNINNIKESA